MNTNASEVQDGSAYKVPFTTIISVENHPKADRLDICTVYGFQVITQKNKYKIGDKVIYIPIDSILPNNLETILFPEGSKITLHNSRVRQIRIRGLASQGMLVDPKDVVSIANPDYFQMEQNLAAILGVTKYEPPEAGPAFTVGVKKERNKKHEHPLFHKYNGVENVKWYPEYFKEGVDQVVIQCKLHGTNARASVLPYHANSVWKKIKKFFNLAPKFENCYGSNNVDISSSSGYTGWYGEDVYGKCFQSIDVFSKIKPGEIVYGEIVGPGIQENYSYGLSEHHFVLFDVKILQDDGNFKWLDPQDVELYAKERGFEFVPVLYVGLYNKKMAYCLTKGPSAYCPIQKVREGIVIKARTDYDCFGNKRAVKWINEEYLDNKDNSDFH